MKAFMEFFVDASLKIAWVKDSMISAEYSITSKKASMEAFVEVTSMEDLVEAVVEASVKVTSVEAFILSILQWKLSWNLRGNFRGRFRANHFRKSFHNFRVIFHYFHESFHGRCRGSYFHGRFRGSCCGSSVEVTSVEAFIPSISSMEAIVEAFVHGCMQGG